MGPVHSQVTDKNNSNGENDDNPVPSTSQELQSKGNPKNSKSKENKKPEKGEKQKDGLYPNLRFVQDMTELSDDSSEEEDESVSWAAKMAKSSNKDRKEMSPEPLLINFENKK